MKAGIFYGKGDCRVENVAIPEIAVHEVLIKVKYCGVCGTDMHIHSGAEGSAKVTPPVILGHEFAGEVIRVGELVKNLKAGDRVSVDPNMTCGCCRYCRNGKVHLCERLQAVGVTQNGGFAEYCAVPYPQAYPIDAALDYIQGAFVEPVACCIHGIDLTGIQTGDTVMIIGGGTIGLIMLQLAKLAGAARVVLVEPVAAKRDKAKELGADWVIDPDDAAGLGAFMAQTNGGADVSIECVGKPATIVQAIKNTAKGGTILVFGVAAPDARIPVSPFEFFQRELTLKTSFVNPFTHRRAIQMLAAKKINVERLVAQVFPLDELPQVFTMHELLAQGKVMIQPGT